MSRPFNRIIEFLFQFMHFIILIEKNSNEQYFETIYYFKETCIPSSFPPFIFDV